MRPSGDTFFTGGISVRWERRGVTFKRAIGIATIHDPARVETYQVGFMKLN